MPPSSSPSPRLTGTRKRAIPNRYGQSVSWSAIAQSPSSHPSPSPSSPGQPDQAQTDRLHAQYQHTSTLPEHQTAALAAELAQEEGEEVDEESDSQDEYHDDHRRRRHSSRRGGLVASKPGSRTTPRSNAKGKAAGRRRGDSVSGSESDSEDESDSDSDDEDDDDDEEDSSDYSQGSDDDDGEDDDTVAVDRSRRGKAVVEDEAVEFENETFTRLVDSLQDTSKQAGALRRAWDTSIEEETSLFESDLRAAAGFKKKKNVRRAPREQQLSHEVRDLLSKANIAYVESNLDEAIEKLEEVIRIEPAVLSAWKTLGLIYNELGQREKALQFRIIGAHLTPRASDEWKDLANQSRELGLYQQSIFCLQQAIKVDKDDIDAIWDRSIMLKDLGDSKAAINGLVSILERQPNDPEVIRELIPLLVSAQDYSQGVDILESSRRANMDQFPDPTSLDEAQTEQGRGNTFSLSELVTLADLLLLIGKPVEAVNVIRTTSRWLDGRASESYWDQLADDREFDEDREGEVARSREPSQLGPIVEFADPHLLDPEVRLRLGKARMMMGQTDEAKLHFDLLLQGDPADAPHLYGEIGDCLFDHKRWDEALDVYNDLANVDWIEDVSLYAKMGACYSSMGELDDAIRMYEPVVEAAPDNLEWRMALAEIYEQAGEKDKSLEMLKGIVRILQARREAEQQDTSAMDDESIAAQAAAEESQLSFFDELIRRAEKPKSSRSGHSRSNAERLRQQRERIERQREEDTMISWRRLNMLESDVFVEGFYRKDVILACREQARKSPATEVYAGSATNAEVQRCIRATGEWLAEAAKLTDSFRSTPQLFPSTKKNTFKGVLDRRHQSNRTKPGDISSQAQNLFGRLQNSMMEEDAQDDVFGMEGGEAVEQKTFRGVDIDDWITLFMQYAIVLTKVEEDPELVNDMFSHLLTSNVVWASDERKLSIHLCWIACGLYSRDYDMLFTALRWVANEFQFHNEPLRLALSLIHATGLHSLERFLNSKDMKFYQRRMRYAEAIAGGIRHYYNPIAQRWVVPQSFLNAGGKKKHNAKNIDPACDEEESGSDDGGAEEEEGEAEDQEQPSPNPTGSFPNPKFEDAEPDEAARVRLGYPTKPSVVGEVFYSYMLLLSASYQPSAGYLARSFAYQQSDPLICLSAAVAFLGRSTNRQTDNRHHMVMQGVAFLSMYKRLRGGASQETEYNFGRAFHGVGLLHLAVPHYERVLEMAEKERESDSGRGEVARVEIEGERDPDAGRKEPKSTFGMVREAAYNLSVIYTTGGSAQAARALYEKWLVVE